MYLDFPSGLRPTVILASGFVFSFSRVRRSAPYHACDFATHPSGRPRVKRGSGNASLTATTPSGSSPIGGGGVGAPDTELLCVCGTTIVSPHPASPGGGGAKRRHSSADRNDRPAPPTTHTAAVRKMRRKNGREGRRGEVSRRRRMKKARCRRSYTVSYFTFTTAPISADWAIAS